MVLVLVAAVLLILAFGEAGNMAMSPSDQSLEESPDVANVDDGLPERGDRLIGTIGAVVITKSDLATLDGFFPWKDKYDSLIYYLANTRYRLLDPVLVKAIMFRESSFNPNAVRVESRINDKSIGLMQILTMTARWVAPFRELSQTQIEHKLYDPITNTDIGMKYLTYQIGRYGRSSDEEIDKVIAAYNAGTARFNRDGVLLNNKYVVNVRGAMRVFADDFPPLQRA